MISVEKLTKYYGEKPAVKDLTFEVKEGEIYGLLGPNGSGKTTTMRILSGITEPSSGRAEVRGLDVEEHPIEVKKVVGFIPENPKMFESLTTIELFNLVGSIRGIEEKKLRIKLNRLVQAFELEEYMNQYVGSLSFGTKQKVSIVSAILHDPEVIIMDEAMNGLDPKMAKIFREILFRLKEKGNSMIFSTHVLPLAEMICDRVGLIAGGELITEGTVKELKEKSHEKDLEDVFLKLTKSETEVSRVINALRGSM